MRVVRLSNVDCCYLNIDTGCIMSDVSCCEVLGFACRTNWRCDALGMIHMNGFLWFRGYCFDLRYSSDYYVMAIENGLFMVEAMSSDMCLILDLDSGEVMRLSNIPMSEMTLERFVA